MKIHFIGIGGIGMSALARYYLNKGFSVSGSDMNDSDLLKDLQTQGAEIYIGGHVSKNIKNDTDLVIYTAAIEDANPEIIKAKEEKIRCLSYAETLGELSKNFFTIAISGTHGKTTTTAMISLILIKAGLDPTVVIGTKVREFGNSNLRIGHSKFLVIEACEYEDSFLNYHPQIGVILNIEEDHLDYFKNFENIKKSFNKFADQSDYLLITKEFKEIIKEDAAVEEREKDIEMLKKILKIPGDFNIKNALCALAVARRLNIKDEISFEALSEFAGTWRRFDIDKDSFPFLIINDYAHHPTEITATLKGAREKFPEKKITCVYQPHQYERTFSLKDEFVKAFQYSLDEKWINELILYPIYTVPGRESSEVMKKIDSKKLNRIINRENSSYFETFEEIGEKCKTLGKNDILIIMGAGNIYNLYDFLKKTLSF